MSKILLLLLSLLPFYAALAQTDSTETKINTEVALATRNIWRGLDYGSSPSVQGTLSVSKGAFEIGTYGTTTLNGSKEGYGTWVELFVTARYKQFSLTLDDYFFFNAEDSLNNYFEWNRETTQHFIESRLKWDTEKIDITAGYAFYKNEMDDTNGIYLEAEYSPSKNFSVVVAGLTGGSNLSFYDRGGITTIGMVGKRTIQVSDTFSFQIKTSFIVNPSYNKSVEAPGVGTNPVYFVVYLVF
jgi:hypothetical protein